MLFPIYDFKNDEEHGLDMLYDNALDDGPMLIDNPPCLVFITLCEDKNDILATCDNTLTHESPTLFLNSPIHTMEEKLAYVEKYLCGLQLSVPNICCNHDIKPYIDLNNYFERGKRSEEHTSELQSLRRISYAVFCLKKIFGTKGYCKPHKYFST